MYRVYIPEHDGFCLRHCIQVVYAACTVLIAADELHIVFISCFALFLIVMLSSMTAQPMHTCLACLSLAVSWHLHHKWQVGVEKITCCVV